MSTVFELYASCDEMIKNSPCKVGLRPMLLSQIHPGTFKYSKSKYIFDQSFEMEKFGIQNS